MLVSNAGLLFLRLLGSLILKLLVCHCELAFSRQLLLSSWTIAEHICIVAHLVGMRTVSILHRRQLLTVTVANVAG